MKRISQGTVLDVPFPSSLSIRHQQDLVRYLDELQTKMNALQQLQDETTAELDALLPSVLDRAFKGQS